MERNVRMSWLLGLYGRALTSRQAELLQQHYDEDLSLGEIAQKEGISRQGVHDAIRRGEGALEEMERQLGLLARWERMDSLMAQALSVTHALHDVPGQDLAALEQLEALLNKAADWTEEG